MDIIPVTPSRPVQFHGDSLRRLRGYPPAVRQDIGYQIHRIQVGLQPVDFKPMPSIGAGVEEIRVRCPAGAFRVIYTARLADAVHVLHVFGKKTRATGRQDVELARKRYAALLRRER